MGELNRRSRQRLTIRRQALEVGERGRLVEIGGPDDPAIVEAPLVPPMTMAAADGGAKGTVDVRTGNDVINRLLRQAAGLE